MVTNEGCKLPAGVSIPAGYVRVPTGARIRESDKFWSWPTRVWDSGLMTGSTVTFGQFIIRKVDPSTVQALTPTESYTPKTQIADHW